MEGTLGKLVANFDFASIRLPLIRNSFTLWRSLAFDTASRLPFYPLHPHAHLLFHQLADCRHLRLFVEKLQQAEQALSEAGNTAEICKGVEVGGATSVEGKVQLELADRYSHLLWNHSLYCELFEDLVALPYLAAVFPPNKKYRLAARYAQISPVRASEKGGVMEKVSEGILKKGFGELTEKVFTRTFLLRASSIAVRLNPVAIGATFVFSSLVDYYRRERKEEELLVRLQELIETCSENVERLRRIYEESMGLVSSVLRGEAAAGRALAERVGEVLEADWLEVVRFRDEDEWEVVVLEGDPEAQD